MAARKRGQSTRPRCKRGPPCMTTALTPCLGLLQTPIRWRAFPTLGSAIARSADTASSHDRKKQERKGKVCSAMTSPRHIEAFMGIGHDSQTGPGFLRLRSVLTGNSEVEGSFHEEGDGGLAPNGHGHDSQSCQTDAK